MFRFCASLFLFPFSFSALATPILPGADIPSQISSVAGLPEPLMCQAGETPVYLKLVPTSPAPLLEDIGLHGSLELLISDFYRFGFCLDAGGNPALREIFFGDIPGGQIMPLNTRVSIPAAESSESYETLISGSGLTALDIRFVDPATPAKAILLKGWSANGKEFLTLSPSDGSSSERTKVPPRRYDWDPTLEFPNPVAFGTLADGDPFVENEPRLAVMQTLQGSGFSLSLEYEVLGTHQDFSLGYRFLNATIVDELADPVRTELNQAALSSALSVTHTHHGFGDGFTLTWGERTYSLLTSPQGGWTLSALVPGEAPRTTPLSCPLVYQCGQSTVVRSGPQ